MKDVSMEQMDKIALDAQNKIRKIIWDAEQEAGDPKNIGFRIEYDKPSNSILVKPIYNAIEINPI